MEASLMEGYIQWFNDALKVYGDDFMRLNCERERLLRLRNSSTDTIDWFTFHLELQETQEKARISFLRFLGVQAISNQFYTGASNEELLDMLNMWLQI